jgi:xylulokinase
MRLALGLDLGTQGVKALLLDGAGRVRAAANRSYRIHALRPGWAEQDPLDWWAAAQEVIREVLSNARGRVEAVGLSGQMHGAVLLDTEGVAVRPCLIWADARADAECAEIRTRVPAVTRITGNPVMTAFTAPKLLWLRRHEPHSLARARTLLLPKDYLRYRLTCELATDPTDAGGTLLFDLATWTWSEELLAALDLPRHLLPEIRPTLEASGRITREAAEATGLAEGTPVLTGGADMAIGLVGCGATQEGEVVVLISTAGQVLVRVPGPLEDGLGRVYYLPHVFPRSVYAMGAILSAGICLRWLSEVLHPEAPPGSGGEVFEALSALAATAPPGADGLVFLPYLLGTGTPHMDPHATGTFVGLTLGHGRAHLARAVMEGVAYGLRDSVEALTRSGIRVSGIRLGGGGARSTPWRQVVADVFNAPVQPLLIPDVSPLGAAVTAAVHAGLFTSLEDAVVRSVRLGETIRPDPARAEGYDAGYARYRALYPALRPFFGPT